MLTSGPKHQVTGLQKFTFLVTSLLLLIASDVKGTPTYYTVTTPGDTTSDPTNGLEGATGSLRYYLNQINLTSPALDYVIQFDLGTTNTITLVDMLPVLNLTETNNLTINGSNGGKAIVIDGGDANRAFIAKQGVVNLQNLTIKDALAEGGNGSDVSATGQSSGGGGGMAAGAAIYVHAAAVTLSNVTLDHNQSVGGTGGSCTLTNTTAIVSGGGGMGGDGAINGGGGGLGGDGGSGLNTTSSGGGGGGGIGSIAIGGAGSNAGSEGEGIGGGPAGDGGSNIHGDLGGSGGIYCGGGGGGSPGYQAGRGSGGGGGGYDGVNGHTGELPFDAAGGQGGWGGGGGAGGVGLTDGGPGGDGGFGGGGGSSVKGTSGAGGTGGGGAGGVGSGKGGNGGFGGGGGGGSSTGGQGGGYGGGANPNYYGAGGGGAALGGAIFVDVEAGGSITFAGPLSLTNNRVTEGDGGVASASPQTGTNGAAAGSDLFVKTSGLSTSITFSPGSGETITFKGSIGDNSLSTLPSGESYAQGQGGGIGISMIGNGTLILDGTNTYAQQTTVSNGTLVVNGSIANTLYTAVGTFLKGTGTIIGASNIHGTLSPGNSIGTLYFGSSLTLGSDSTLSIELEPTSTSYIVANTTTLQNGTLEITPDEGTYSIGTEYTILYSPSILGNFSSIISPPKVVFDIGYYPTSKIVITLRQLPILNTNDLSGNNLAVANYLNFINLPYRSEFTTLALLSNEDQAKALLTLSPSRNSFNTFTIDQNMFLVSNIVSSRTIENRTKKHLYEMNQKNFQSEGILVLANDSRESLAEEIWLTGLIDRDQNPTTPKEVDVSFDTQSNVWFTQFGEIFTQQEQNQNPEFGVLSGGVMFGFDQWSVENGLFGGGISFVGSNILEDQNFGSSTLQGLYPTIYASLYSGHLFLDMALWGGINWVQNERNIFYSGFDQTADGNYISYAFNPHIGVGFSFDSTWVTFEPFISADWVNNFDDSYKEKGAGIYNLEINSRYSSMLQAEGGLNTYWSHAYRNTLLTIIGKLSYIYRQPFSTGSINSSIIGYPGSFDVISFTYSDSLFSPSLELFWKTRRGYYFSLLYEGEFNSNYISNELAIKIGRLF